MIYRYVIQAPGSDMHNEPIEVESTSKVEADKTAARRVKGVFILASAAMRASAHAVHVATFTSRRALAKAEERAYESGTSLLEFIEQQEAAS